MLNRSWTSSPTNRLFKTKRSLALFSASTLLSITYYREDERICSDSWRVSFGLHLVHYPLVNMGDLGQLGTILIKHSGETTGYELFHVSCVFIAVIMHLRKITERKKDVLFGIMVSVHGCPPNSIDLGYGQAGHHGTECVVGQSCPIPAVKQRTGG